MQHIAEVATSAKVAVVVSAATTSTGLGTLLELIPSDVGKLATLAGFILSIVLTYVHLRRGNVEHKKISLEIEILEEKEYERLASARERKAAGLPIRRNSDGG